MDIGVEEARLILRVGMQATYDQGYGDDDGFAIAEP